MDKKKVVKAPNKKQLTRKQKKFAELYANHDLTQTEACRRAGYQHPRQQATRFLNNADFGHVQQYIGELEAENRRRYDITFDREARTLHQIREEARDTGQLNNALNATSLIMRLGGLLIDRKEILHGKVDQMSREEVEKRLAELMKKQNVVSEQ